MADSYQLELPTHLSILYSDYRSQLLVYIFNRRKQFFVLFVFTSVFLSLLLVFLLNDSVQGIYNSRKMCKTTQFHLSKVYRQRKKYRNKLEWLDNITILNGTSKTRLQAKTLLVRVYVWVSAHNSQVETRLLLLWWCWWFDVCHVHDFFFFFSISH